jgi:tetratricopeptide (TPR) repeat protein
MREAQAMARLSHPNVIAVHDVGLHGDQVFVAMELIEGQTLRQWLSDKPRTSREVLEVLLPAGRGLAAAHEVGIVHRDFKPDNVMLARNGSVRVLDFGLARSVTRVAPAASVPTSALNRSLTAVAGTPAYMAPEQLAAQRADARSDQFAFCVTLHEALTGKRPFAGATTQELLAAIRQGYRDGAVEAQVPSWLRPIIARGLAAEPAARHASMPALLAELGRDPAAARRRLLLAVGALVAVAAVGALGYQQSRRRASLLCRGAEARLADVWDGPRRERVRAAFAATGVPYAADAFDTTARALEHYAEEWKAMHVDACLATRVRGEQSEELLDLRMSCLDQRRDELRALTELFTSADAKTVQRAAQAAYSLSEVSQCANIAALKAPIPPPRDPAARAPVEQMRKRLAETKALVITGKFKDGLRAAQSLVSEARRLQYAPLTAEALLVQGQLQQNLLLGAESEASFRAAMVAAAEGHHETALADGATRLVWTTGYLLNRHEEGRFWADFALASIRRLGGNNDNRIGTLMSHLSDVAELEGKLDESLTLAQRSVEQAERTKPGSPSLARKLAMLAHMLTELERYDEALVANRRAIEISEKTEGPNHPDLSRMIGTRGIILTKLKRYDEALELLRRVAALDEAALGPTSLVTALDYSTIGDAYEGMGDYDKALGNGRHAIEIIEAIKARTPVIAGVYQSVGGIELKRGRPAAAVPLLERALSFAQSGGPAEDLAQVKLLLAQALWQAHGDRQRAVTLVREARAVYAATPRLKSGLDEADAWLATHRR